MRFSDQTRHALVAEFRAALDAGDHARARTIASEVAEDADLARDLTAAGLDKLDLGVAA